MKDIIASVTVLGLILGALGAWLTHIVVCIQTGAYLLLIAGAIVAPVGMIHGVMIWCGIPWAH
jgi:hypothetical protein